MEKKLSMVVLLKRKILFLTWVRIDDDDDDNFFGSKK